MIAKRYDFAFGVLASIATFIVAGEASAQMVDQYGRYDISTNRSGPQFTDIDLAARPTFSKVEAVWGEMHPFGPAQSLYEVQLHNGDRLWLSFSPGEPRTLVRAILLGGVVAPTKTVLLNDMDITKRRSLEQVDLNSHPSEKEIQRRWGPPDNRIGSGMDWWVYEMADGTRVLLSYGRGKVAAVQVLGSPAN